MKDYEDLTYLGRIRRMRELARIALTAYGITDSRFCLLRQAGNTLYKVHAFNTPVSDTDENLFLKDTYLLRIYEPGYQEPEAITHELTWLSDMRVEADLPEPITSLDGKLLVQVETTGVDQPRWCSLLRWVKAKSVLHRTQPYHFREQGKLMARMHHFSAGWPLATDETKRRFDWEGLFANDVGSGMRNAEAWALLTPENRRAFAFVAKQVKQVMDAWGESADVFGLIHGDLAIDANLLFWHKKPRAIDFDDSGYGYWIYDLAVGLEHVWDDPAFPVYRDALLEGYTSLRVLPDEQIYQLELFIAALEVYWTLWATGGTHLYPDLLPEYQERMQRTAGLVVQYWHRVQND